MALTRITKGVIKPNENYDTHNINSTGIVTAIGLDVNGNADISGNMSVGGVLTYEDVTSIDSVGIITAQKDIHVGAGVSVVGIVTAATFKGDGDFVDIDVDGHTNLDNVSIAGLSTHSGGIFIPNNEKLEFSGSVGSSKIRIYQHAALGSMIEFTSSSTGYIGHNASGAGKSLVLNTGNDFVFKALQSNGAIIDIARFYKTGQRCALNADGVEKFTTSSKGIQVGTGVTIETNGQATFSGITTFSGNIELTGALNTDAARIKLPDGMNGSPFTGNLELGNSRDFVMLHDGHHNYVKSTQNMYVFCGSNNLVTLQTGGSVLLNRDLDVDGHTNLDNVSVAGITTFSNGPVVVNGQYYRGIINSGSQEKIVGGYISGSDTLRLGESMYLTSTGLGIGVASPTQKLDVGGNGKFNKTGNCNVLIGSTNAGGAAIVLDGDSDGNGSGTDYAYIEHDTSGNLNIVATNPADSSSMKFHTGDGSERLQIKSDGKVLITNTLGLGGATSNPGDLLHAQSPSGEGKIVIIGATTGTVAISGLNGTSRVLFGDSSTENAGNITYTHSSDTLSFRVNGNTRWKFDSSGHFIPDSAGAVNIGSASAEIGNVYLADSKAIYLGSNQAGDLYNDGTDTYFRNSASNGQMLLRSDGNILISNYAANEYRIKTFNNGAVELYYDQSAHATAKLATTATGVSVHGEVAASQDYPMVKPTLDCNFVLNKKLDPRIGYTRKGVASFYDEQGILKIVGDNVPRFDHNPETRESLGILIEEQRTNLQPHSEQWSPNQSDGWVNVASGVDVDYDPEVVTPTGETTGAITFMEAGASGQHYIAPDTFSATSGTTYTFSFFFKNISGGGSGNANNLKFISSTSAFSYVIRNFYFDGTDAGTSTGSDTTITKLPNGWWRGTVTLTATGTNSSSCHFDMRGLNSGAAYNNKIALWGYQVEEGAFPTSYIRTGNSDYGRTATRGVDFLQIQGQAFTDLYNPVESTILCSYQHTKEVATIDADLGGSRRVYRFGTGDTSSDTRIDFVSTSTFHPFISGDGSSPANLTATAPTRANVNTYATRVKENDFATTKAGGSIASDTSGSWDPVNKMIEVQIGGTLTGTSEAALQAHYKRFTYYPVGLPNSQLITISS